LYDFLDLVASLLPLLNLKWFTRRRTKMKDKYPSLQKIIVLLFYIIQKINIYIRPNMWLHFCK
jgi:hypothetical protein